MADTPIKIVQGNWFGITQSLQKVEWEGETQETVPYEPVEGDEIHVFLSGSCVANSRFSSHEMGNVSVDGNEISYDNNGTLPLGLYDIEIRIVLSDGKKLRSIQKNKIQIVKSNKEAGIPEGAEFGVDTFTVDSAIFMYVPTKGDDGKSAYEIYLDNAPAGQTPMTEAQWLASLKGPKGDKGDTGAQGATGLQGPQGPQGLPGQAGSDGSDGVGVEDVELNNNNSLTFTLTDGSTITTDPIHISGGGGSGGQDGVGIDSISVVESAADGDNNVVTITLTNSDTYTFNVKNGSKGSTGAPGQPGAAGSDGHTPYISNGYWFINDENTGVKAVGEDGIDGTTPIITASAEISNTSGNPSVSVSNIGTVAEPEFHFSFSGLKGESGGSSGGEANVIDEIQVNGAKINPVNKVVNINSIPAGIIQSTTSYNFSFVTNTDKNNWNGKTDKVQNATNGHLAGLDTNGNLTDGGFAIVTMTQVQYDALSTPDSNTIYLITES